LARRPSKSGKSIESCVGENIGWQAERRELRYVREENDSVFKA